MLIVPVVFVDIFTESLRLFVAVICVVEVYVDEFFVAVVFGTFDYIDAILESYYTSLYSWCRYGFSDCVL